MAFVSRCQSKAEKRIQTLQLTVNKLHTASPSSKFETIVDEATIVLNNSPSEGLPRGLTPKDLLFARPTNSFFLPSSGAEEDGINRDVRYKDFMKVAREAERDTLVHKIKSHITRQKATLPTSYTRTLRAGDLALRKRTIFPVGAPKKLCHKLKIEAYKILKRVATNSFRVVSVVTGVEEILPGDLLCKVKRFDEEGLRQLVEAMRKTAEAQTVAVPRRTRSSRLINQITEVDGEEEEEEAEDDENELFYGIFNEL